MRPFFLFLLSSALTAGSQAADKLPTRLESLQANYNAAVERATAPLTTTYIAALNKEKAEYLRAGDLAGAQAANSLLEEAMAASSSGDLSTMSESGFKRWLRKVKIKEQGSPLMMEFSYNDDVINSFRPDRTAAAQDGGH